MTIPNLRNRTAMLLAATCLASASMSFPVEEARAWDCLLDTDNDGNADDNLTHRDTDGGANSGGQSNRLACGLGASAANAAAIAIGYISRANGAYSIAIGSGFSGVSDSGPRAQVTYGISIGFDSKANGAEGSIGIGGYAVGGGAGAATAIGYYALVGGDGANGTAIGARSQVTKEGGVALGHNAIASGRHAIAIGGGSNSVSGAQAEGTESISIGNSSDARSTNSVAIGVNADTNANYAIALGTNSVASGTESIAIGRFSTATSTNSVALGAGSVANAIDTVSVGSITLKRRVTNVAMGQNATDAVNVEQLSNAIAGIVPGTPYVSVNSSDAPAMATGTNASALGPMSIAGGTQSAAIGFGAEASNTGASAFGNSADASGGNSAAVGSQARASGNGASAFGFGSNASANRATSVGRQSVASGVAATSVGELANASGASATAVGQGATAAFNNSTAIGKGATATAANQVTLGGSGSSVVVADIDASTSAQVGPVDVVTVDATGTLGRQAVATSGQLQSVSASIDHIAAVSDAQFDALTGRVSGLEGSVANLNFQLADLDETTRGGIASAVAMGGMMVVPEKTVSISLNAANYRGEQGFAGGITARISDSVYLSGGIGGSTAKKSTTTRVGVAFGF